MPEISLDPVPTSFERTQFKAEMQEGDACPHQNGVYRRTRSITQYHTRAVSIAFAARSHINEIVLPASYRALTDSCVRIHADYVSECLAHSYLTTWHSQSMIVHITAFEGGATSDRSARWVILSDSAADYARWRFFWV